MQILQVNEIDHKVRAELEELTEQSLVISSDGRLTALN